MQLQSTAGCEHSGHLPCRDPNWPASHLQLLHQPPNWQTACLVDSLLVLAGCVNSPIMQTETPSRSSSRPANSPVGPPSKESVRLSRHGNISEGPQLDCFSPPMMTTSASVAVSGGGADDEVLPIFENRVEAHSARERREALKTVKNHKVREE